jgi:hypothetical protein
VPGDLAKEIDKLIEIHHKEHYDDWQKPKTSMKGK